MNIDFMCRETTKMRFVQWTAVMNEDVDPRKWRLTKSRHQTQETQCQIWRYGELVFGSNSGVHLSVRSHTFDVTPERALNAQEEVNQWKHSDQLETLAMLGLEFSYQHHNFGHTEPDVPSHQASKHIVDSGVRL